MPSTLEPPADLMAAATALDPDHFERFVTDLLRVRAGRTARTVRADEAALLARLNAGPSPAEWADYHRLRDRLRQGVLTPDEHTDLLRLTDVIEQYQAVRAGVLAELAAVRGRSLAEIADDLGIAAPAEG